MIENVYQGIEEVILHNLEFNKLAMKMNQSWGYHGYKRLNRHNSKILFCECTKLTNNFFDKYRKVLTSKSTPVEFHMSNVDEYLDTWNNLLKTSIDRLVELNNEHFRLAGMSNGIIECLMCQFLHDYEKVGRWHKRFSKIGWENPTLEHDIQMVNYFLHEKMKEIEEKHQ